MSEKLEGPAIKLFGKSISLPPSQPCSDRDLVVIPPTTPPAGKTSTSNEDTEKDSCSTDEEDSNPKKPDKIIPCQRCNSMDTKFCYYNNYNINQPRHFCKKCQRYWTGGGNMRSVPVGSGRRKIKIASPSLHYPPMVIRPNGYADSFTNSPATIHPFWRGSSNTLNLALALGKHSRDQLEMINPPEGSENRICIPKTMRIDDPIEAARSSMWSTLGIMDDSIITNGNRQGLKGLPLNVEGEENCGRVEPTMVVLGANPAATIRSARFHERP